MHMEYLHQITLSTPAYILHNNTTKVDAPNLGITFCTLQGVHSDESIIWLFNLLYFIEGEEEHSIKEKKSFQKLK
jgi:hypothetical protein